MALNVGETGIHIHSPLQPNSHDDQDVYPRILYQQVGQRRNLPQGVLGHNGICYLQQYKYLFLEYIPVLANTRRMGLYGSRAEVYQRKIPYAC
jgi:hypothetical protein